MRIRISMVYVGSVRTYRRKASPEKCKQAGYPSALLECPDFILTTLAYLVSELTENALRPLGLRVRAYRMLRILYVDGPQRQSTLGAELGIDRTSIVALVDELERAGLVKRERSPEDRRAYAIRLTAKGTNVAMKAIERVSEAERAMFRPLAQNEEREFQRLAALLLAESGPIADQHRREFQALIRRTPAAQAR